LTRSCYFFHALVCTLQENNYLIWLNAFPTTISAVGIFTTSNPWYPYIKKKIMLSSYSCVFFFSSSLGRLIKIVIAAIWVDLVQVPFTLNKLYFFKNSKLNTIRWFARFVVKHICVTKLSLYSRYCTNKRFYGVGSI
jgi:hypothetical protein